MYTVEYSQKELDVQAQIQEEKTQYIYFDCLKGAYILW